MQNDVTNDTSDKTNSTGCNDRRKRINRMKTAIIMIVIILLMIPMICCILLSLQVNRLQKQVDQLISLHSQYDLAEKDKDQSSLAYAAVKEDGTATPTAAPSTAQPQETGNTAAGQAQTATGNPITDMIGTEPGVPTGGKKEEADSKASSLIDGKQKETDPKGSEKKQSDADKKTSKEKEIDNLSVGKYAGKKIYLTFDDGPSVYTDDILDILKENGVKATFFVVGKTDDYSLKMYKRIVEEGHTLGMHSYSHQYSKIYNSVEDFEKDFTKLWKLLYDTTGYKPSIFRFPGGSDNMVNKHGMKDFIRYLNKNDIVYFDWNVLNGDATGVEYTKEQLIDNVLSGVDWWDNSIVLMHDSQNKKTTVDSLPGLLKLLKSEGAQILPIDKDVTPVQMIKADTIK